ncbi:MAG: hypothetical protein K0Q66_1501 [Chitinophagaceae bacterium]|jgi:hypothetical protein|nr:hypothetical protein [Chitinophagaceae bacterium]
MENQSQFQVQQPLPNATAVLVLGIVSIVGCFCYGIVGLACGIIALVLGNKAIALYNADPAPWTPSSYSNVKAGRICAIIGLSISALYLVFVVIVLVTVGFSAINNPEEFFREMENRQ